MHATAPVPHGNSAATVNLASHRGHFRSARPSLIRSLIQLRSEASGAHHRGQAAEVTDPLEPRRTQAHRLTGKGVPSRTTARHNRR